MRHMSNNVVIALRGAHSPVIYQTILILIYIFINSLTPTFQFHIFIHKQVWCDNK